MQGFLVALCVAILEKLVTKGTVAASHLLALKAELEKNQASADKYQKTVDSNANREERRKAEDELLG